MLEESNWNGDAEDQELNKNQSCPKVDAVEEEQGQTLTSEELKDSSTTPLLVEDSDAEPVQGSKTEEDHTETGNSQEKTLKKPSKVITCPRCNSMDTKFCYFNNYNVNQPRHFCKNCQRYWTAGGSMRNVPVGAGRRKNKNTPTQYRHLTVPEGLQNARVDLPNGMNHPMLRPSGTVITFSSDTPLCESMVSALNIADKTVQNGFHRPEEVGMPGLKENGDDHSSRSSTTAGSSKDGLPEVIPFPPQQVACIPGAPWPYPWPSVQWTAQPASFAPLPYWGCAWNVPWIIPPIPSQPPLSGPSSPTLGKHSRDDNTMKPANPEEGSENERKCLWVPKTLRIDDPGEAAKSSIWATLGIKNDTADSVGGGAGLFRAFQSKSKGDENAKAPETSTVLQANPAALSRSLSFQETT